MYLVDAKLSISLREHLNSLPEDVQKAIQKDANRMIREERKRIRDEVRNSRNAKKS